MKKKRRIFCDRCGKPIPNKKVRYRYPFVKDRPSNTCLNIIWQKLITLCDKCVDVFDKNEKQMREKYHYKNNQALIDFYKQYGEHNHG